MAIYLAYLMMIKPGLSFLSHKLLCNVLKARAHENKDRNLGNNEENTNANQSEAKRILLLARYAKARIRIGRGRTAAQSELIGRNVRILVRTNIYGDRGKGS